MRVVSSGYKFIDIDAYGSIVALAELLRLQGEDAVAASGAPFNASVPPLIQSWEVEFERQYKPDPADTFVVVDISEPEYFDKMVVLDRVTDVIDHHPGFEELWKKRWGSKAQIDFVGAAATLVYERWLAAGLLDQMSQTSARLLACGILDNTLNLGANITTQRDRTAYADLAKRGELPQDWPEQYFTECQSCILSNIKQAIADDAKMLRYPGLPQQTYVGQLALWNAQDFIHTHRETVQDILSAENLPWYMNLIDIHTGCSVFFCQNPELKKWLANTLDVAFMDDTATADRMWLRKEIMKRTIDRHSGPAKTAV